MATNYSRTIDLSPNSLELLKGQGSLSSGQMQDLGVTDAGAFGGVVPAADPSRYTYQYQAPDGIATGWNRAALERDAKTLGIDPAQYTDPEQLQKAVVDKGQGLYVMTQDAADLGDKQTRAQTLYKLDGSKLVAQGDATTADMREESGWNSLRDSGFLQAVAMVAAPMAAQYFTTGSLAGAAAGDASVAAVDSGIYGTSGAAAGTAGGTTGSAVGGGTGGEGGSIATESGSVGTGGSGGAIGAESGSVGTDALSTVGSEMSTPAAAAADGGFSGAGLDGIAGDTATTYATGSSAPITASTPSSLGPGATLSDRAAMAATGNLTGAAAGLTAGLTGSQLAGAALTGAGLLQTVTGHTPSPPAGVEAIAAQNQQTSADLAAAGKTELSNAKTEWDRLRPVYDTAIETSQDVSKYGLDLMKSEGQRYKDTFAPVQDKVASDAMNWDSTGNIAQRSGEAVANVQRQFENARGQRNRTLAAMGLGPDKVARNEIADTNSLALARAGAANTTASGLRKEAVGMRQWASNLGNQIEANSVQAGQLGQTGASQSAAIAGNSAAARSNLYDPAIRLSTAATTAGNSAADSLNAMYRNQVQQNASDMTGAGNLIGAGTRLLTSSIESKENVEPISDEAGLEVLRKAGGSSEWDYKPGEGDGGHHIGPMAEQMNAAGGEAIAPRGKAIDPITTLGTHHSAIRAVDKRLLRIERELGLGDMEEESSMPMQRDLQGLESLRM